MKPQHDRTITLGATPDRSEAVPLRPHVLAGPFWMRHRQFLLSDRPILWRGAYHIRDLTTGQAHIWGIWPDRVKFGVSTMWAHTHPGWTKHQYVFVPRPTDERVWGRPWWRRRWLSVLGRLLSLFGRRGRTRPPPRALTTGPRRRDQG